MSTDEILETIAKLRAMGARRCVVAGIEVDFAPQHAPVMDAAPRLSPEAAKQAAREDDDALIYAACG